MTETFRPEHRTLEPPPGEWLFKLQGEVLGPVPAQEIIDRMSSGEVDETTPLSLGDGEWVTLGQVESFLPFLYQAKAEIRARLARLEAEAAARKRRIRRIIKIASVAVALVIVSFVISYLMMVYKPWRSEELLKRWAAKHVPLLWIEDAGAQPPTVAQADLPLGINIDQILIDDAPALVSLNKTRGGRLVKAPVRTPTSQDKKKPSSTSTSASPETETEGLVASSDSLSNEEIISVVYAKANISRLFECLRQEKKRNPDMPSQVVIEFSIANDGRVGEVRMDDPSLSGGELHQCMRQKLAALRFREYSGQVRNVTIPFNVGGKK